MSVATDIAQVYADLIAIFGTTATFNGITEPCLNASIAPKSLQQLVGYIDDATTNIIMLRSDFDAWQGLQPKVSVITLAGEDFNLMDEPRHSLVHPLVRLALSSTTT